MNLRTSAQHQVMNQSSNSAYSGLMMFHSMGGGSSWETDPMPLALNHLAPAASREGSDAHFGSFFSNLLSFFRAQAPTSGVTSSDHATYDIIHPLPY